MVVIFKKIQLFYFVLSHHILNCIFYLCHFGIRELLIGERPYFSCSVTTLVQIYIRTMTLQPFLVTGAIPNLFFVIFFMAIKVYVNRFVALTVLNLLDS